MAGFQDQLIGPAPYVETLPVDAYTRVGMIKQQQYDQGVQKVQGMIDSVAGIEALMPEQKDYVNKAVGQLQNQVQTIASADFSNQQVVNSVGHLTNQIASDPIIQNTIYSANAYRNESQKMKLAQESGKSSPANEYVFQRQVANWMGSRDPSKAFNASYTPYTDYKGKMVKALNDRLATTPDEMITELPYKRGADGKPIVDEHGLPVFDYNTLIEKYKGVSAEKIRNVIESTLDDNDKQQIGIDGQYEYRGAGKGQMKDLTDRSYQGRLDKINDAIQGIQVKKSTSQGDPQALKELDSQLSYLKNTATSLQEGYLKDIDTINSDNEGYKASLYAQNWLSKFSEGYSYAQHSLTYGDNPGFKNALAEKENNLKWEEFKINKAYQGADLALKREELSFKEGKLGGAGGIGGEGGNLSSLEPIENQDKQVKIDEFIKSVDAQKSQADLQDIAFLASNKETAGLVERKFDDKGNAYFAWAGKTKAEQDANALKGQSAINTYLTSDTKGDSNVETWKANTQALRNNYKAGMKAAADAEAQADKVPELNVDNHLKALPALSFRTNEGNQVSVGNKDVLSFSQKLKKLLGNSSNITTGTLADYAVDLNDYATNQAANNLFTTPNEKAMWQSMKRYRSGYPNVSPEDEKVANRVFNVDKLAAGVAANRSDYLVNVLKNVLPAFQPVATPLSQWKGPDKKAADVWVKEQLVGLGGKANTGLNFDNDKFNTMLGKANIENTSYYIIDRGDGKYSLRLENTDVIGSKKMEIDLPTKTVENLLGGSMGVDIFKNMRQMQRYSALSDGPITTNVLRQGAETATPLNNGNITGFKVKYDVEQGADGGQKIRLYVYDNNTKENKTVVLNPGVMLNEAQVISALQHMNDDTIKTAIKEQPAQ